ncbi:hypothetical protein [Glutamicibacter sp.]|uniref:hypothetical protein n=1 Tax=Glutamicibacter sp. TaxID=1931995 RepID=UPI002B45C263|nr:hypothetical protein [Glutamicibacter sp.]HJX78546.1 hypothetical protein [Glutamicibacter sp.]
MAIHNGYVGAKTCTTDPRSGAKGAMAWFLAAYKNMGAQNSGIFNCRPVRGSTRTNSLHGEWRAVDFGLKWASDIPKYQEFAEQLRLNSKELGIQCIIFNRKIFSGGYKNKGWYTYTGVNPHTDHLHVELTWAAAGRSIEDTVALWEKELRGKITGKPVPVKSRPKVADQSPDNVPDGSTNFPDNYANLKVNGNFLSWEIGALQILLENVVDGKNGRWDGKFEKLTITDTMTLMQRNGYYLKTPFAAKGVAKGVPLKKDGKAVYWFWVEFQRMLADDLGHRGKVYYDTRKWLLDGKPEKETGKAIQRWLNDNN